MSSIRSVKSPSSPPCSFQTVTVGLHLCRILENVLEGEVGARGEMFVGAQFGLVFLVIIAPVFQVS